MAGEFSVAVDRRGRIDHFAAADHPDEPKSPQEMRDYLDGGERVKLGGIEYELNELGCLTHPDVEVPENAFLGFGVRIDEGTVFHDSEESFVEGIIVRNNTRVSGTELHIGVALGEHNVIKAKYIGRNTMTGDYVRIGREAEIGADVVIDPTAKLDDAVQVSSGVHIGENVRLGFNTRACKGADIGAKSHIGVFGGAGPRGVNQDGPLILAGRVIPPSTHLRDL